MRRMLDKYDVTKIVNDELVNLGIGEKEWVLLENIDLGKEAEYTKDFDNDWYLEYDYLVFLGTTPLNSAANIFYIHDFSHYYHDTSWDNLFYIEIDSIHSVLITTTDKMNSIFNVLIYGVKL